MRQLVQKIKTQLLQKHIDALAVAVINDHKTAHKHCSFPPFEAYHNTKKVFSFRGLRPLTPDSWARDN